MNVKNYFYIVMFDNNYNTEIIKILHGVWLKLINNLLTIPGLLPECFFWVCVCEEGTAFKLKGLQIRICTQKLVHAIFMVVGGGKYFFFFFCQQAINY